jgi:hypothetical protein
MVQMARIVPMMVNTTNRTTATWLPLRRVASRPTFTSPATHAPTVTAVLKGIRRRTRTGGRRGRAPTSSAGMSAVTAANSP